MAKGKKIKNSIDNDFDFDSSLDFDDLDFSADPFKDDRKPVTKIKDGLRSGVKARVSQPSFVTGVLKELLPRGFGDTLDLGDKVATSVRQLYTDAANEVKPAINDFKRVAARLAPKDSKYLPDPVKKLLKEWEEEAKRKSGKYRELEKQNQRDSMIALQLGQIFEQQFVQTEKDKRESDSKDLIKEGIELNRHRDLFTVLNQSSVALSKISQYQTTINLQYQKKSLELQHRQLFTQYDILETIAKTHALQTDAFSKIVKNTALPDWQKINVKELASERFFSKASDTVGTAFRGMFPSVDEYLQLTARKLKDRAFTGIKKNIQGFRSGLTEAESKAEFASNDVVDKYQFGGEFAGEYLADTLGHKAAKRIKEPLAKHIPALDKAGAYLENLNENLVDTAEKFRTSDRWKTETGPFAWLMRTIQSALPSLSVDRSFSRAGAKDLNAVEPFTLRTNRSINEIIPGYLSRILQEIQIIRTGNPNIDRVEYDQDRGKFIGRTALLKSMSASMYGKRDVQRTNTILDDVLQEIDPNNDLSVKDRDTLKETILKNKLSFKDIGEGLSGGNKQILDQYMSDLDKDQDKKLVFNRRLNSLARGTEDPREKIDAFIQQGRANELVDLGVLKRTKSGYEVDVDVFARAQLGKDPFSAMVRRKGRKGLSAVLPSSMGLQSEEVTSSGIDYTENFHEVIKRLDYSIEHYKLITDLIKSTIATDFKKGTDDASLDNNVDGLFKKPDFTYTKMSQFYKRNKKKLTERISKDKVKETKDKLKDLLQKGKGILADATTPGGLANNQDYEQIKQRMRGFVEKARGRWQELYVEGEDSPRIVDAKLKAGHYFDEISGKVIKAAEEIKGAIKDRVSGKTVLGFDEIEQAYIKFSDGTLSKLTKYVGGSMDTLLNKFKGTELGGIVTEQFNKAWSQVKDVASMATSFILGKARDVWVEGEKYPRLTAVRMQQGEYYDAVSGKTIYTPSDIQGEVKDSKGETKISVEELDDLMIWDAGQKRFAPIRKLLRGIGKVIGGVSWYYKKIGIPLTKFNFRMIGKATKLGVNVLRMTMGAGPLSVKDVYVGDEKKPRLYAVKLREGQYFNKSDGRPIYHQNDINGEIIDINGETVIPDEDLPNLRVYDSMLKLLNPFRPLKWLAKTAGKLAGWAIKKGLTATKFLTRNIGKVVSGVVGGFVRYISKPEDVYVKGETTPRLKAVLMKAGRYVSEKTGMTIFLPSDIDGPVWDQQEEIRVLDKDDIEQGLVKEDGTPLKATMLQNALKGIKAVNKLFSRRVKLNVKETVGPNSKLKKQGETTGEQTVSLLGDIKNIFEDYFTEKKVKGDMDGDGDREGSWQDIKQKRDAEKAKRDSNKPGSPEKKEGEKKGGLMGILATALDAIAGFLGGFKNLFKAGGVLGGLGKLLGLGKAAGTVAAAAGGMGTLGAIGAGLAAVVSSPVTLGIVGAAAVGYGAYKGYKAVRRWMSKPSTLDLIRYTQYGFKKDNTGFFNKIVDLEEYMKQFVKIGADQATLDEKKMDIDEMMSIFGFSHKNNDHKRIYGTWYMKRFKPVYLTHVTALNIIKGNFDLTKLNELKKEEKLKYIEATKFSSGPYTVTTLPVLDGSVTASTGADVAAAVEAALKEFATEPGGSKSTGTGLPTDTKKPEDLKSGGRLDYGKNDAARKLPGASVAGSSAIGATIAANAVSAFDTVRYKTYGLKELEKGKVVSLIMLENLMAKKVMYRGTKATFDGNPNELLEKVTTYFGIPDLFSEAAIAWTKWFRDRFLPVYLNYATLHMQAVNKPPKADNAPVLEPDQQYDIALALSATGGAWRVTDTPWEGYELNTNPDTVKANLEFIKDAVKQKTMREEQAKENAKKQDPNKPALNSPKAAALAAYQPKSAEYNPPTSGSVSATSKAPVWDRAGPSMSGGMGTGPATEGMNGVKPDPSAKVPDPTGPGINGLKDTIVNAAKVVGIDPNIMLTTAAIESDFNPNAKAPVGSASGLMQFISDTWKGTIAKHGAKYGYDQSTSPFDAKASALMGAHYVKDSLGHLSKSYKGAIGSVEAYLVHFMGPAGAARFLKAMQENPGQYGSQLMPKEAAANPKIYFGDRGPRTLGEMYQWFYNKVRSKAARYGISLPASSGVDTSEKSKYVMPGAGQNTGVVSEANKPTVSTSAYTAPTDEAPKSAYNPTARPAAKQQQAVQASRQAATPLNDAVGFNPKVMGTGTETTNAGKNTLTADLMKNTETILSQSLDVQKETLDVMKMIYEKINNIKAPEVAPKSEAKQYEAPKAPVPMRKSA